MALLRSIRSFFSTFNAAIEASAAVEAHRAPKAATLKKLGISPDAFTAVHL